ncbi:hypothetical protein [Streptomyces zagrosensis]|uniref:Uncharacterized protein n=1 Tax=Streptomyces zagrosensis TaxID=1042984 RepID=A0A7W9UW55_9ACTN|nr:hypothetical protein [Streptomyces zagrosensis]MBB5933540.1 hypothetical protein [Streptomyces zagrosensis]
MHNDAPEHGCAPVPGIRPIERWLRKVATRRATGWQVRRGPAQVVAFPARTARARPTNGRQTAVPTTEAAAGAVTAAPGAQCWANPAPAKNTATDTAGGSANTPHPGQRELPGVRVRVGGGGVPLAALRALAYPLGQVGR